MEFSAVYKIEHLHHYESVEDEGEVARVQVQIVEASLVVYRSVHKDQPA